MRHPSACTRWSSWQHRGRRSSPRWRALPPRSHRYDWNPGGSAAGSSPYGGPPVRPAAPHSPSTSPRRSPPPGTPWRSQMLTPTAARSHQRSGFWMRPPASRPRVGWRARTVSPSPNWNGSASAICLLTAVSGFSPASGGRAGGQNCRPIGWLPPCASAGAGWTTRCSIPAPASKTTRRSRATCSPRVVMQPRFPRSGRPTRLSRLDLRTPSACPVFSAPMSIWSKWWRRTGSWWP